MPAIKKHTFAHTPLQTTLRRKHMRPLNWTGFYIIIFEPHLSACLVAIRSSTTTTITFTPKTLSAAPKLKQNILRVCIVCLYLLLLLRGRLTSNLLYVTVVFGNAAEKSRLGLILMRFIECPIVGQIVLGLARDWRGALERRAVRLQGPVQRVGTAAAGPRNRRRQGRGLVVVRRKLVNVVEWGRLGTDTSVVRVLEQGIIITVGMYWLMLLLLHKTGMHWSNTSTAGHQRSVDRWSGFRCETSNNPSRCLLFDHKVYLIVAGKRRESELPSLRRSHWCGCLQVCCRRWCTYWFSRRRSNVHFSSAWTNFFAKLLLVIIARIGITSIFIHFRLLS